MRLNELTESLTHQYQMRTFANTAIALVRSVGAPDLAKAFAQFEETSGAWRDTPVSRCIDAARNADRIMMTGVPGTGSEISGGDMALWGDASSGFIESVNAQSVLGRIEGALRVPLFNKSAIESVSAAGAAWVEQGKAIPVTRSIYAAIAGLPSKKVASMVVMSSEVATTALASNAIGAELTRAVVEAVERKFLSADAATAAAPAGIWLNAVEVVSSGDLAADISGMVAAQNVNGGQPTGSVWITPPAVWSNLTLSKVADAAGTLAGMPVIVSAACTRLTLLAAKQLVVVQGNMVELSTSSSGMIEQDDSPTGDIIPPTGASATRVGLFTTDSVALKATLRVNWAVAGPTGGGGNAAVVVLVPS